MCNVISFVCLEYFDFLYVSILPYMFALGLFLSKVYEVVLLRFDIPFCVEVFCLLKESLFYAPLFYSFQNLIVH
jgi:hypothetical protein